MDGMMHTRGTGWLALLVSLALHGILLEALSCLPGRTRVDRQEPMLVEPETPTMTFLAAADTDILIMPPSSAPQVQPKPIAVPTTPSPAGRTTPHARPNQTSGAPAHAPAELTSSQRGGHGKPEALPVGTSTTFFRVPARGLTIVYVIDGSASMGPTGALGAALKELLTSLERLPATARYQIIVYNRTANPLLPRRPEWLAPSPETLREVSLALEDLQAEGGTDHAGALYRALSMQPDVMFFLTDGDDLSAELLRETARRNHGRTMIHAIELNAGIAGEGRALRRLAAENRGSYQGVNLAVWAQR